MALRNDFDETDERNKKSRMSAEDAKESTKCDLQCMITEAGLGFAIFPTDSDKMVFYDFKMVNLV